MRIPVVPLPLTPFWLQRWNLQMCLLGYRTSMTAKSGRLLTSCPALCINSNEQINLSNQNLWFELKMCVLFHCTYLFDVDLKKGEYNCLITVWAAFRIETKLLEFASLARKWRRHNAVTVPSPVNFGLHCAVGETVNEISLWVHLNHWNRLCIDHRVSAFRKKKIKK